MRLVMFHPVGHALERGWVGRIEGDQVVHLAAQTLQSFLTGGGSAREHAVYPLADVRLLAPVLHPPSVRVFDEQGAFAFANPAAILGPAASVAAPGAPLDVLPRLAAIVGADGELAGYTLLADWRLPAASPPKDRDFALGLGPLLVTPGALAPDPLEVVVRVEGEERGRGRLDGLDWPAARDLAAAGTVLRPGDVLAGPAAVRVQGVERGSSVDVVVEGIGTLSAVTD